MPDEIIQNQDSQNNEPLVPARPEVVADQAVKANLEFVPEESTPAEPVVPLAPEPTPEVIVENQPVISDEVNFSANNTAHTTPVTIANSEQTLPQTELEALGFVKPSNRFMAWLREKALAYRRAKTRKKLDKIMVLFAKHPQITNDMVEKLLHVSHETASNYLITLAKENKIKRLGAGSAISYSRF